MCIVSMHFVCPQKRFGRRRMKQRMTTEAEMGKIGCRKDDEDNRTSFSQSKERFHHITNTERQAPVRRLHPKNPGRTRSIAGVRTFFLPLPLEADCAASSLASF